MKKIYQFCWILLLILSLGGCNLVQIGSGVEPLPVVESLPLPQLPQWIEQISPTGDAQPLSQILIRFKEPLIPVESLDSTQQQSLLNKFEIIPPLAGQFRFLTPRMVGFQADEAIPKATRVKVTLKSGLKDLKNHQLDQDIAWTFQTEAIQITNLPGNPPNSEDPQPIDIKPILEFTSNVELDLASISEHSQLIPEGKQQGINLKAALKPDDNTNNNPEEKFEPSGRNWIYTITPNTTLKKATRYRLEFSPGLRPLHGNLASSLNYSSQVFTYSPLALKSLDYYGQPDAGGTSGRFVKGSPQLKFNNGLVAQSALNSITLSPASKQKIKLFEAYDDDNIINLNPWALEPQTNYSITINKDLKDKFGQTLEKPVTLTFNTGDVEGDIWVPSGLNIFPSGNNLQLDISTVNLPESNYQAAFQVVNPTDLIYTESAYPSGSDTDLLPSSQQWSTFPVRGTKNQTYDNPVPLKEKLGGLTGMLAYGVKAKTYTYQENNQTLWREPEFYGLVQLTNLGVFAQWFPESGLIRVNHLSDGSAVENAQIEIYQSKLEQKTKIGTKPCATSQTDLNGIAIIEGENWQQCISQNGATKLLVIAREGEDWAYTRTDEYSGSYEYGINAGWDEGKPISRGVIFSDRQLYQPGETAYFSGTAYYLKNGSLQQDKNTAYQITLTNPDGKKTNLGTQKTNNFGTFSLEFTIDKNLPLGYYSLVAKSKAGVEINGEFRLAEFKPPTFGVDLNLDKEFASIDQVVTANTDSHYFFGSPVESGKLNYFVTRQQTNFIPKGWEKFTFGRQWFWPEEPPQVPNDVLQSSQSLDNSGKNSQQIPIAKDLPYPMTYRVEAQVTDVSNISVSNVKTFTALPDEKLIGLQNDFVANANQAFPIKLIVTNPQGEPISGEKIRVELQAMKYSSITQLQEGSSTDQNQVEYKTITQQEIVSANEPQTISFTPSESGSYRLQANFANQKDEVTATDTQIWVTGETAVDWGDRYENNRLEIELDKQNYQVGDIATALIQSPYPEGELYFAVVRHNILYSTLEKIKSSAPKIQFKITPEMLPNAAVEAVLVRQGKPLSEVESGQVSNLIRIGFAPFNTNLDDKYLQVKLTPQTTQQQPGKQQTLDLELKNDQGTPLQGQLTLMVVNEAILQLTGYRPPDLVKTVYADQDITTRLSDNRPQVVLKSPASPLEKGWGYGGGLSAALGSTEIRTNFRPLAYYNGSVLTDRNGKAKVSFYLPDDLTTWRVMAVATDGNFHFGNGEATFITTKPLATNPVLPPFARNGDRFSGGVAVTNTTGKGGNLTIEGYVNQFLKLTNNSHLRTDATEGTQAYRFPMEAVKTGTGNVQFLTQLNGQQRDAFSVPLEVEKLDITEQVITSGTTKNEIRIPINIDQNVVSDVGGLDISLSGTLVPSITVSAEQVFDQDQFPFLETSASQLSIAANLELLNQTYKQKFTELNLTDAANKALENLQKLQLADGGFATIPREKTANPLLTAYAAESLYQAKKAGFFVNPQLIKPLKTYLQQRLANPSQEKFCDTIACKNQIRLEALIALAQLGEKRSDFLQSLYEQRQELDRVGQIKLARYLSQFTDWKTEAQSLSREREEFIYETGRTATVNLPQNWDWFNSNTTAQAQTLRLFMAQNAQPEIIDRLWQGLVAMQRQGTWVNSYDTAQALAALVEYSQQQPPLSNFKTTILLDNKVLANVQFKQNRNANYALKIPMQSLPRGQHNLMLKNSGNGTLHYLTALHYRPQGEQNGRFNGLRVNRLIFAANQPKLLDKQGLYPSEKALTLSPGEVFDIGLEIISDHPIDHLLIIDPLPAGLEAIDTSFQTASSYYQSQQSSWAINYQQIYRDKIAAYSDHLEAGVYTLHYLVRSVTPGSFDWPGATVSLQYAPEEFGRCTSSRLEIKSTQ
ncbi:alpha-2-macroglobulin family protein [Gloeothece verrucosa]|uniref:Alpha-2-macroglobulin domain protein n=1 Tax=Gloeothece verrucosa (strain PCC 7822) TaxID=497965 RepID=E0U5D6_GLOV7|nr:alpha-2-macroglobulin [Gloeothece verrucosa]ADN13526.1 alpha-2-macroglobulin domain protein [Gloeothece verrucosa PCC 7822]